MNFIPVQAMGSITSVLNLWIICFLMFLNVTSSYPFSSFSSGNGDLPEDPYATHFYTRFSEVKKACDLVLSTASDLEFDVYKSDGIKAELSFVKGDWNQESGKSPLMPFDDSNFPNHVRLATFTLMHFDPISHFRNALNVSGALALGISSNGTAPDSGGPLGFPDFRIWQGSSELVIPFEGVYTESRNNGGERVLCLLGHSRLPHRQTDSTDPWEWAKHSNSSNFQPSLVQDDQILLVLRYPKMLMLTHRAVRGELKSLNGKSSDKYFDDVFLTSQLGAYSNYKFTSEELDSIACDHYPDRKFEVYKGDQFCELLDRCVSGEFLNVVPNWNCNSTDEYCSELGPFESDQEIKASDGGFANVGIMMQDIRCELEINLRNASSARVSAVFRVIPPSEKHDLVAQRSGLNSMTISAEGIWNSSTGQLCMVGCLGLAQDGCDSRISLYASTSFSIKQRNIIIGIISSINETSNSFYPLTFKLPVHPLQLSNRLSSFPTPTYEYSRIKLAGSFLERSEPFDFGTVIKKSLLSYPRKGEDSDELVNLFNLADDLTLHVPVIPDPSPEDWGVKSFLQLEILSLGPLFRRSWVYKNASIVQESDVSLNKASITEKQLLLNVSAELTLSEKPYNNVSLLYMEGLYNPVDGKMYLIACRDVHASWKILFDSMDLEDGLDCLVEVKVEYPPTIAGWLMNPTAKVSITSKRNEDDPLHFSSIKLQTLPILYSNQRQDILSHQGIEGILCIITISIAIACILSQLFYIRENSSVVPYISLVMLGVQALGYSIPLITGTEALFARITSDSYGKSTYDLDKNQWYQMVDYLVKILVVAAFLLTLRLGQKVWKSRIRLLTRAPLEPRRVPNEKKVLLIISAVHFFGFLIVIVVHGINMSKRPIKPETFVDSRGNTHKLHEWGMQIEEYIGLVQDFFLLPQIIGNCLWRVNFKPLRKAYYFGITVVRLLPHIYDFIRAPGFNPYFSEDYEFANPNSDFFSKFGDIAIPVTAAILGLIVYAQQRLRCEFMRSRKKPLPLGSSIYERLPSATFEAELVSGVNETPVEEDLHKDGI